MGRKATLEIGESIEELQRFYKKQKTLRAQKRVGALVRIKEKRYATRQELADHLEVHIRTLERWINSYKDGGLTALVSDLPRRQGSKIITAAIHEGLSKRVHDPHGGFLGYWDAQRWIEAEYKTKVKYHRVRAYLIQHFGTKVKTPRKSHVSKDEEAVALFKNAE